MTKPQQPELHRSEETPSLNPDAIEGELEARDRPDAKGQAGPVPKANRAGSKSGPVQDKPDGDKFAAALGMTDASGSTERKKDADPERNTFDDVVSAWVVPPLRLIARLTERSAEALRGVAERLEQRDQPGTPAKSR